MSIESLYIHVPFCRTICSYCDFCHFTYVDFRVLKWMDALYDELNDKEINKNLKTIYIGGGTPTSLDYEKLNRLLELLKPYTNFLKEYTIEVNPETIDEDKVKLLKKYGINRVSIGLQSSDKELLKLMNRHHDFKMVKNSVDLFKKHGITNISIDVMYGLPNQTLQQLEKTLDDVISLNVPHISIYSLTIEPNTLFQKRNYKKADDDLEADMYDLIIDKLKMYKQYEISNFCLEGYESLHNLAYWNYDDFYGISMGASGKEDNVRYDNTRDLNKYLSGVYVENIVTLNKKEIIFEHIMMNLRKKEGMNIEIFNKKYDIDFQKHYKNTIDNLINKNFIEIKDNYIKCTDIGFRLLNTVLEYFMEE